MKLSIAIWLVVKLWKGFAYSFIRKFDWIRVVLYHFIGKTEGYPHMATCPRPEGKTFFCFREIIP